ncbi:MAG TPA: DUF1634 domain-containing protein [Candidatus Limnocylindrales bacterium]|nr:DUF1634 domain-containing protein [Candidatus Limnocylindrales bacterium]
MLIVLTYGAVALLAVGVALMASQGVPPLSGGPQLDIGRLAGDLASLAPSGFLWLGLLAVIATPVSRVVAAGIGYARAGDRALVVVAIAILAVLALSVATALVTT